MSLDTFISIVLPGIFSLIFPTCLFFFDDSPREDINAYIVMYIVAFIPLINIVASIIYFFTTVYYGLKMLLLKIIEIKEIKMDEREKKELSEIKKYKKLKRELINFNYFKNEQAIENFIMGSEVVNALIGSNEQDCADDDWNSF
jgi:predicted membrane protein